MEPNQGFYSAVAGLLAYPDDQSGERLDRCRELASLGGPEAASHLADFDAVARGLDRNDAEEIYTRTFDLNPPSALEIGWHLFGEEYHRGALLVRIREELAKHGIQESCELPDHLIHVLPLIERMDPAEAARFVPACVTPAVSKVLASLKGKQNPYEHLLRGLVSALVADFGEPEPDGGGLLVLPTPETRSSCHGHECQEPTHARHGI